MGYDKLISFISKNLNNKSYEQLYPNKEIEGVVLSKYVYFDINYIIYKCINEIENIINKIIKYICSKNYNDNIKQDIYDILKELNIIDLNIDKILSFKTIIESINEFKKQINSYQDILLYNKILNYILFCCHSISKPYFIKYIYIFFDGIPTYSKILEQRKRRLSNYINSKYKKKNIMNYFIIKKIIL